MPLLRPKRSGLAGELGNHSGREGGALGQQALAGPGFGSGQRPGQPLLELHPGQCRPPRALSPGELRNGVNELVDAGVHQAERVDRGALLGHPLQPLMVGRDEALQLGLQG
jgi:hypothetical protein